jgi:hypothetical protein
VQISEYFWEVKCIFPNYLHDIKDIEICLSYVSFAFGFPFPSVLFLSVRHIFASICATQKLVLSVHRTELFPTTKEITFHFSTIVKNNNKKKIISKYNNIEKSTQDMIMRKRQNLEVDTKVCGGQLKVLPTTILLSAKQM